VYEELISTEEVVDLSPPLALDRAEHFLTGQGYVVVHRTATTLTVARKGSEGAAGHLRIVVPIGTSTIAKAEGSGRSIWVKQTIPSPS
jgi:hypothetical protein